VSPLGELLARRIRETGPITIAEYMAQALGHPEHGYYSRRDPFGRQGDFITAPEISQIFGELVGLWCADTWERMGRPQPVHLVELGPGRGTLMSDALRAARVLPAFRHALRLHLVETSPFLRARQAAALGEAEPVWHATIDTLPDGPAMVVANEFFDALPVHQFQKTARGWRERLVTFDEASGNFAVRLAGRRTEASALLPKRLADAPPGAVFEVSPSALAIARALGQRLAAAGGAALIIDYGYVLGGRGDTLQAVRGHRRHDVFADPGEADLTAHVDFAALGDAASAGGARFNGPVTQGSFLRALGIATRLERLLRGATPTQAVALKTGCRRLIEPGEMGTLFKVLALADPKLPPLAGFPTDP
jgi:NADH dehydrogenase [ubiquinone] 1 alpha subcomplex assembly factor 7